MHLSRSLCVQLNKVELSIYIGFKFLLRTLIAISFIVTSQAQQSLFSAEKRIDGGIEWRSPESQVEIMMRCEFISVQVSFIVMEDGSTGDIKLEFNSHEEMDVTGFIDAVSKFQYQPRIEHGVAVKSNRIYQDLIFLPEKADHCQDSDKTGDTESSE